MLNENIKESRYSKCTIDISKKIVDSYVKVEESDTGFTEIMLEDSIDMVVDFISCLPTLYQKKVLEILGSKDKIEFIKEDVEGLKGNPSCIDQESKKIDLYYRNNIGDYFHIIHEIWHKIFLNGDMDIENELLENPIILEYKMYDYFKQNQKYLFLENDLDRYMLYLYQENYQHALEVLFKNELNTLYQKNQVLDRNIVECHLSQLTDYQDTFREYYEEKFNFVEGGHVFDFSLLFQYILSPYLAPTILKGEDSVSKIIQIAENFLTDDKILDRVVGNLENNKFIDNYKEFYEMIISSKKVERRR